MGITEVECVIVEMDEEKEKALNVALNKISGEWDNDKLALLIADLQGADFDVSLTGFEPEELEDLFREDTKKGVQDDDFDMDAELAKPTFSKAGDLWLLGDHRLVCGDSTNPETYELLMNGKLANLVVTDPPYNVNYEGSAGKIKNDNMENSAFYQFLLDAYIRMYESMADDASIYVFHADTEGLNFRRAFSDAGFYLSGCCIWKKQSLVLGRSPYQWMHEPCLFGWKKSGKHQWYTGRKETTIWEFDKPNNGVLIEKANITELEKFALLFEFDGDVRSIRHVLYNCTSSRPSIESETKEDTIEPGKEKLTLTADPREDGLVKSRTGDEIDAETYKNWYQQVYVPVPKTEG